LNDNSSSSSKEEDADAHVDKEEDTNAGRQAFNKELVAEQAALRSSAEKAISSATNADIVKLESKYLASTSKGERKKL